MNHNRFRVGIDKKTGVGLFDENIRLIYVKFSNPEDAASCCDALMIQCNLMNNLYNEKQSLIKDKCNLTKDVNDLLKENKLLRKHNHRMIQKHKNMAGKVQGLYAFYQANRWDIWREATEDICKELGIGLWAWGTGDRI